MNMVRHPWSKFFWSDWESDEALRQCSLAAQGLWMRLLCICAKGTPTGYLTIAGRSLDTTAIAKVANAPLAEVETLMEELEAWDVFSRDSKGRIYNRRIVRDEKRARKARQNGAKGGNPALSVSIGKQKEKPPWDNPLLNLGDKTQKPEARSQSKEKDDAIASSKKKVRSDERKPPGKGTRLAPDWRVTAELGDWTRRKFGWEQERIANVAEQFWDYWIAQPGQRGVKLDWDATWRNWCRREEGPIGKTAGAPAKRTQRDRFEAVVAGASAALDHGLLPPDT